MDPDALLQVLLNLLDNAIEAVEEGGTVTVKLRFKADRVVLSVLDDGPGIPADVRDRLFRPFVTSKVQGTGLGLPLSKQIAEAHGGTLIGETRGDGEGGARFVLMVPRSS